MIIYIDLDGTLCSQEINYKDAKPIQYMIDYVNSLYHKGNTIIIWTARGTGTGIDWEQITKSQLNTWGVKYHKLKFKKPIYDLIIDDKAINPKEI
jgi:histidinol phosphatase-like enzyme